MEFGLPRNTLTNLGLDDISAGAEYLVNAVDPAAVACHQIIIDAAINGVNQTAWTTTGSFLRRESGEVLNVVAD